MTALTNSLRYSDHLVSLEFGGNRLSSLGVSQIFKTLNENKNLAYKLKTIDLSENHIGKSQINNLVEFDIKVPKLLYCTNLILNKIEQKFGKVL